LNKLTKLKDMLFQKNILKIKIMA